MRAYLHQAGLLLMVLCLLCTSVAHTQELMEDPAAKPKVFQLKTSTLRAAIEAEGERVNWYHWYLHLRQYFIETRGLNCPLGSEIQISRNGEMKTLLDKSLARRNPALKQQYIRCAQSLMFRKYPLPPGTELEAVNLPVRSRNAPPASQEELLEYLRQSEEAQPGQGP